MQSKQLVVLKFERLSSSIKYAWLSSIWALLIIISYGYWFDVNQEDRLFCCGIFFWNTSQMSSFSGTVPVWTEAPQVPLLSTRKISVSFPGASSSASSRNLKLQKQQLVCISWTTGNNFHVPNSLYLALSLTGLIISLSLETFQRLAG